MKKEDLKLSSPAPEEAALPHGAAQTLAATETSRNPFLNPKTQSVAIALLSIFLSLIAASVIILLVGKNPLDGFRALLQGSGLLPKEKYSAYKGQLSDFLQLIDGMSPMIFASLAVTIALKAGLFNIGVSGQMLLAGFLASITVGYSGLPWYLAMPLALLVGMVAGAALGSLIAFLRYRFNINEVVSSIMLNYIVQYVVAFFIQLYYIDPVSRQSRNVSKATRLTLQNVVYGELKLKIPLAFPLAILCAVLLHIFLKKKEKGFAMRIVGLNPRAARYAGLSVSRNLVLSMVLSGALAGLAGVSYYLGYYQSIQPRVLSPLGFDAIAVALLGNAHPIGIIFSSFLISILAEGSTYMSSSVGLRQEIGSLITGMVLLFSACGGYIRYKMEQKSLQRTRRPKNPGQGAGVGADRTSAAGAASVDAVASAAERKEP